MTHDTMLHQVHSSSSTPDLVRRSKVCTNCRRRKIKCDTARPKCNQCRLRPPKSLAPCYYPFLDPAHDHLQKSPSEMVETIRALEERVRELELLVDSDTSRVYLSLPYITTNGHALSVPATLLEPAVDVRANLVDVFLERFAGSGYFFFDPVQFKQSTLLPFPFGHQDRPSPALLSAVYLWGSVLLDVPLHGPHTPDAFLMCVIQNIPQDLASSGVHSKLALEILQAEVMLSLYFMRCTEPVQGRYHCAAAASLALGARLHLTGSPPQNNQSYPSFPMRASTTSATTDIESHALEAVLILSNCWVAADGAPSPIPCGISIDTPRPHGGSSLQRLLSGADITGLSSVEVLAKAGILLKRIIWFAESNASAPDLVMFSSLERRLLAFRAQLPPLPGDQVLILTHAHTDLALLRLHAPYSSTWEHSRFQALAACARITEGIKGLKRINLRHVDPVFGPIYWTIANFYLSEISIASQRAPEFNFPNNIPNPQAELSELSAWLAWLAPHSPIFERCLVDIRMAVDKLPHQC
ncbi:hypothetical protein C8R45DRAFT_987411 [Mycena sanguinolenta]|nr:hypothetical protein C8R45DRAFT_987411 [Mycena sanguinolenta]